MSEISSSDSRTISALFDTQAEAGQAVDRLVAAGIAQDAIRLVPGHEADAGTVTTDRSEQHRGFFGALSDFFFPDEDRYSYAEGLSRGGYLVVVNNLQAGQQDTALDILDDEGSVNLDEREASWRSEGWGGYDAGAGYDASAGYTADGVAAATSADFNRSATGATSPSIDAGDTESIPVVDERLIVGKRDVNAGRVRVRSYVREEPVSADVNLHDEHVSIERRPVDRVLSASDDVAFQDRIIEAEEHAEEAVIGKEARVTEEISLRKDVSDRTETINDTVRKTEVEIEDERTDGVRPTGTTR